MCSGVETRDKALIQNLLSLSLYCWASIFYNIPLQIKKDLEDVNAYKNKIKDTNKKLEDKVKELEDQLAKNKSKMKSQKVQLEQLRKAQKAKDTEEEGAKGKAEVGRQFQLLCPCCVSLLFPCRAL